MRVIRRDHYKSSIHGDGVCVPHHMPAYCLLIIVRQDTASLLLLTKLRRLLSFHQEIIHRGIPAAFSVTTCWTAKWSVSHWFNSQVKSLFCIPCSQNSVNELELVWRALEMNPTVQQFSIKQRRPEREHLKYTATSQDRTRGVVWIQTNTPLQSSLDCEAAQQWGWDWWYAECVTVP